jgi:hypothetical protein
VGFYFAIAGSDGLHGVAEHLSEVRKRREKRSLSLSDDGVIANIVRCEGINAGRPYPKRDGDRAEAARILGQLDDNALRAFDEGTAKATRRLAQKHRKAAGG